MSPDPWNSSGASSTSRPLTMADRSHHPAGAADESQYVPGRIPFTVKVPSARTGPGATLILPICTPFITIAEPDDSGDARLTRRVVRSFGATSDDASNTTVPFSFIAG